MSFFFTGSIEPVESPREARQYEIYETYLIVELLYPEAVGGLVL